MSHQPRPRRTVVVARSDSAGTVYVVSVSGPRCMTWGVNLSCKRVAEDTQLYQIITIDGDELRYVARTAIGRTVRRILP